MTALFRYVLDLSISASFASAAVLLFRLVLKKAPRYLTCLLWCLVAIRLLFPFTIQSPFSIMPDEKAQIQTQISQRFEEAENSGLFWENLNSNENKGENNFPSENNKEEIGSVSLSLPQIISGIWLLGVSAMLFSMALSYLKLKKKMASSIPYSLGVRQSEKVSSPFILGIFRPVIYLPFGLNKETMKSVLLHEEEHLKRGDHLIKPFAFLLLSIHWFNPMMWLSYFFLSRDIEGACDEKVLEKMDMKERKEYARALLECATHSINVYACPLAFGEQNVKGRIKMTLNYKKPVFWIIVLAILVALFAAVSVLTDPKDKTPPKTETTQTETTELPSEAASETKDDSFVQRIDWDDLQEFNFTSGENGFLLNTKEETFEKFKVNYQSENWKEPILLAKSFDDLFYILDHCTEEKSLSEETKAAVTAYFNQKNEEFLDIYPSATPYDFFQDHAIFLFFTPINTGGSITDIRLEAKEEKLTFSLQIGGCYVENYEEYKKISGEDYGELQFVWIAKDSLAKFEKNPITCKTTVSFQTDWIQNKSYTWNDGKNNTSAGISIGFNRYQNEDASVSIFIETDNKVKEYRYRIQKFGDISDGCYMIQRAEVPETLPDEPVKLEYKNAFVFKKNDYILTYDATASPLKLEGIPDKAEFYSIDYLNSLLD